MLVARPQHLKLGFLLAVACLRLRRPATRMFAERLINLADNLAALRIRYDFLVAVVFAIDLTGELVPLAAITMKIVSGNRFVDWLFMSGALVLESDLLAEG